MKRSALHPYQVRTVEFIKQNPACGLWLDLGLGKTIATLTALSDLMAKDQVSRVLVIAPLRVARTVWKQEAEKWDHTAHLDIGICTGTPANRAAVLNQQHVITVINRENVPWLVANYPWVFDTLVIDESSSFKSHSSKRFRALKKVRKHLRTVILLSGTPSPNSLGDMWSQMWLIDQGARIGRTIGNFRSRFCHQAGYMGHSWEINAGAADIIHAAVSDVCLSMSAEDYLDMPDRIDVTIPVELNPAALAKYKEFEKEFLLEIDHVDIAAVSAGVLANKLLQCANGFAYDENGVSHQLHTAKLDALKDIVEDNPDENMLIAYNFKADLAVIHKTFPAAVTLSASGKEIVEWNEGKIKMLLCHPASAGHGLNLQRGGSMIVWYGLNWSLELYQQFNARLHRQGQQRPVRVCHIVAKDTIDLRLIKALGAKAKTQKELLDYLK